MFGFGKNKAPVEVKKETQKEVVNLPQRTTRELVEEVRSSPYKPELEHYKKLQGVIGQDRNDPIGIFSKDEIESFQEEGFTIFVNSSTFIPKFKYAAAIKEYDIVYDGRRYRSSHSVNYIGDIPDTVIDKYETLRNLGYNIFTVHSCSPLKVVRHMKVDPVLVCWSNTPSILLNEDGEVIDYAKRCVGVIVGFWDGDKEEI